METTLKIPYGWAGIGAQLPLFIEHKHTVTVQRVHIIGSERVQVRWRCAEDDDLAGRKFSETFNLSKRRGKERLKAFLFAMHLVPENGMINFDKCRGKSIDVIATLRNGGRTKRLEIIHHLLS